MYTDSRIKYGTHGIALAACLTLLASMVSIVSAQDENHREFAAGFSAGLHGLGVVAEARPVSRLAVVFEAEGLNLGGNAVVGLGGRFDVVYEKSALGYVRALYGSMGCMRSVGGTSSCLSEDSWRRAISPGLGIELRLSETGSTWIGIEVSYWHAVQRDAVGRDLQHYSFAAMVRFGS
jgi:hypothetical protein